MIRKNKNIVISFLVLFLFLVFSYGQTLKMNFWRDDYTMLFKLQHPLEKASHFGDNGLIGSGPYKFILLPHAVFFQVFKLNPTGYFIVGFMLYALASCAIYLFVNALLNNKKAAFFASLFFAAGYIASDGLYRIINSWQNSDGQILALLSFAAFVRFLQKKNFVFYIAAIGLYFASIEFVFVRSHSLIIIIFALDFLFGLLPNFKKELPAFFLRQIPFWILFKFWYLASGGIGGPGLSEKLASIFVQRKFGELTPVFANIGNVLIPDRLQVGVISNITKLLLKNEPLGSQIFWLNIFVFLGFVLITLIFTKFLKFPLKNFLFALVLFLSVLVLNSQFAVSNYYWYRDVQTIIAGMIGMSSFVLSLFIFISLWNKNRKAGTAVMLGWIMVSSQIFGYYILYSDAVLETTHRYLSNAFLGYCLLMAGMASVFIGVGSKLGQKAFGYIGLAILSALLLINLKLNVEHQSRFVNEISIPSSKFYNDLKTNVPYFEKGSLFYFDIQDNGFYQHQFDEFFSVGSMPNSTAIAVYYGVDRYDFFLTSNYNEVLSKIADNELKPEQIYSFYYGSNGLINTTDDFRNLLLAGGKKEEKVLFPEKFEGEATVLQKHSSLTPIFLQMDIYPIPLYDKLADNKKASFPKYSFSEKLDLINFLKSKKVYYERSKATALSDWQYQKTENILDNDSSTSWRGDRIYWHDNRREAVIVDLGANKEISRVVWVNLNHYLTPISYDIETSPDEKTWTTVKRVENAQERKDGEMVIEEFSPIQARYVRMNILETVTDDSPAIAEIEVVESKYSKVDIAAVDNFLKEPFAGTIDKNELVAIYDALIPLAQITVSVDTDKGNLANAVNIPVSIGKRGTYQGVIPAYGTTIESITLQIKNLPTLINLYSISARNMSFSQLRKDGRIKIFDEN
ncbi:MAG: hypothetical protein A2694_01055 [Candidatus Blackburnbacteria bacterium RIFCSPHIGHO2_01_FULL_40_17]|nr:MAG: hypothetical protein UT38_C0004G0009 [Microgenomates group bacterium GW2011_GWA2_39_19]OGY07348.1 MAG: hypothetical protein A2694_01055 [Candidatus Blackburnbacteria bacterium RIFCSPHIGHO2_01_FULL_40_17]